MKKITIIILLLLVLPSVFSLGIAPAKRELEYTQNVQRYDIKIVNNEKKDMDVVLSVDGTLRDHVKLDEARISFTKEEEQKTVSYTVTLPNTIEPGPNTAKIIAEETVPNIRFGESYVAAKLSVVSVLTVQVPYPEKFVAASLDVLSREEALDVTAHVVNKGTQEISKLSASFGIFDEETKVTSATGAAKALPPEAVDNLVATFKTKDLKPGIYQAAATIDYDDNSVKIMKQFQLGKITVLIREFTGFFVQNKINEFNIDIESVWNKEIKNAYAHVYIFRNGEEVASFKGTSFDLAPYESKRTTLYFNTDKLELGEYTAIVTLHYDKETTKKEKQVSILTKEQFDTRVVESGNTMTTYLLIILIIVIVAFIIFLVFAMVLLTKAVKK